MQLVARIRFQLLGGGSGILLLQIASIGVTAEVIRKRDAMRADRRQLGAPLGDQLVLVLWNIRLLAHRLQARLETCFHELVQVTVQHLFGGAHFHVGAQVLDA